MSLPVELLGKILNYVGMPQGAGAHSPASVCKEWKGVVDQIWQQAYLYPNEQRCRELEGRVSGTTGEIFRSLNERFKFLTGHPVALIEGAVTEQLCELEEQVSDTERAHLYILESIAKVDAYYLDYIGLDRKESLQERIVDLREFLEDKTNIQCAMLRLTKFKKISSFPPEIEKVKNLRMVVNSEQSIPMQYARSPYHVQEDPTDSSKRYIVRRL